jgi:hypothetical protein
MYRVRRSLPRVHLSSSCVRQFRCLTHILAKQYIQRPAQSAKAIILSFTGPKTSTSIIDFVLESYKSHTKYYFYLCYLTLVDTVEEGNMNPARISPPRRMDDTTNLHPPTIISPPNYAMHYTVSRVSNQ